MNPKQDYVAVILAGGEARRMEGMANKGLKTLLPLGNKSVLQHIVDNLTNQIPAPRQIGVNIHPSQRDLLPKGGWEVIEDQTEKTHERQGPLAGILAGLLWCRSVDSRPCWMLSISGDTPDLPADIVSRFFESVSASPETRWLVAHGGGRIQPPISLWHTELCEPLVDAIARGERKIDRFAQQFPYKIISWSDCSFENLNSPQEYCDLKDKYST